MNVQNPGKKCTTWELQVKFYLGQNEKCSPGDSTSDSSEKLLQSGRWEGQYICGFGEGRICATKHIVFQKVSAILVKLSTSHHEAVVTMKDFSAFLDSSTYKNWAHKIGSWKYLKTYPASFPLSRVPSFHSPPWTPFRECYRLADAIAHVLILEEIDSKCPWQVDRI